MPALQVRAGAGAPRRLHYLIIKLCGLHTVTPPVAQARQADAPDNSGDGVSNEQSTPAVA